MNREAGQVAVLVLGLTLVTFAVAGVAVDGTRAFLARRSLQNTADSAALAGAGELDRSAYYASGGRNVVLDASAARSQADRMVGLRGSETARQVDIDRGAVTVTLRQEVPTTFLGIMGIESIPVAVQARAEPFAGRSGL